MAERVIPDAANVLGTAGVQSPRVDAELLAAFVLGVPRGRLTLASFDPRSLAEFRRLVAARAERVPVQHLTGSAPFRMIELAVGPGVFIPRPETELLVDVALAVLSPLRGGVAVDLCAGSGAIALSVAHEVPSQPRVYAVERATPALDWLSRNARLRAAAGDPPVTVVSGDVGDPALLSTLDGQVDLVVCNPPYVPDVVRVPAEVAHDPGEAVFGGPDGLAVIADVVTCAARLLRPGGTVAVEHDDSQGEVVPAVFADDGRFHEIRDHSDLAGRPRFTTAKRR